LEVWACIRLDWGLFTLRWARAEEFGVVRALKPSRSSLRSNT